MVSAADAKTIKEQVGELNIACTRIEGLTKQVNGLLTENSNQKDAIKVYSFNVGILEAAALRMVRDLAEKDAELQKWLDIAAKGDKSSDHCDGNGQDCMLAEGFCDFCGPRAQGWDEVELNAAEYENDHFDAIIENEDFIKAKADDDLYNAFRANEKKQYGKHIKKRKYFWNRKDMGGNKSE